VIEHLLRLAAPSAIVVVEVEGPTRVTSTATTGSEWDRLAAWIEQSPERDEAVRWAILDRDLRGGAERGAAWRGELLGDGGGVVAGIERLLGGLNGR
jgi:hypothetical protein